MNNRSGDDTLEMPCLGRPFQLGMLYDCRSDRLIMGATLWDERILKAATSTKPQTASDFKIIAEDSIEDKTFNLDIDASLKLSFLGGLVGVEGSAKYLDDRKSSKRQVRVTLKYWSTTRVEKLTMEALGKVQHHHVFDDKTATHVVTGVLYGAEAFFVFDRQVLENEDLREIHGHLNVLVKAMPNLSIEGSASVGIKEANKRETKKLECKFHGDFLLKQNPSTFEDALTIYKELPQLLGSEKNENTIAKKVWLYPLVKLDSDAARIVREISVHLVNETQKFMEDLQDALMRSNDLMKYEVYTNFHGIRVQLSTFKNLVSEYKTNFTKSLTTLLPQIRGGGEGETKLAALFEANLASPFSHQRLSSWLNGKEREVKVLTRYLTTLSEVGSSSIKFAFAPGELDSMIHNLNNEYILCYAFKIVGKHDTYLKKMFDYLRRGETAENFENSTPNLWLDNDELTSDMMLQARQFRSFAQVNADRAGLQCVVADRSTDGITENKGAVIVLYKNGVLRAFEPPGQPGQPMDSRVTHESIQLEWKKPEYGAQSVQFYTISYGRSLEDPPEQWVTQKTEGPQETLTVSGLTPRVVYYFKVRSECEAGASVFSEVSKPIKTLPQEKSLAERIRAKCGPPIEKGPPLVYKLPVQEVMRDDTKGISKCYFGKPNPFVSTEKVLMVVGATGAGKSTLINGMVNYILGVEWKDKFRFKLITDEAGGQSQAHSQTQKITAYTFHQMKGSSVPYTLTVIDTPGFGDTRGLIRDKEITSQIKEFFSLRGESGIDHLDGIGFVTQAALARLTPTQQYIFDSILSTFGKDIASNIFMMVTFADGKEPPVMSAIKSASIPFAKSFKFNNSALFNTGEDEDEEEENDESEDDENFGEMFWRMGTKSFKSFFAKFEKVETKSLQLTQEVLEERQKLEVNILGLQKKIKAGLSKIDELHQEQQILKDHEADIGKNKDFKYTITLQKQRKVDISGTGIYVTNCLNCNFTCHDSCIYSNDQDKHMCAAMDNGGVTNARCTVCSCRGHWTRHVNKPYRFEEYTEEEERTNEDLQQRYGEAVKGKTQMESIVANMEQHLQFLHQKVLEMIQNIRKSLSRLDEIALKANPLTEVEYIELLIQSENDQAKLGYQQRIKCYEDVKEQALLVRRAKTEETLCNRTDKHWWEKFKFW